MRNLLLLPVIAVASIFISCNSSGGESATTKKNKEVNDAIMKAYEAGDFSKMDRGLLFAGVLKRLEGIPYPIANTAMALIVHKENAMEKISIEEFKHVVET